MRSKASIDERLLAMLESYFLMKNRTVACFLVSCVMLLALLTAHTAYAVPAAAEITVGAQASGIAYDSGKGEVFVANYGSNSVSIISDSNNTVIANVPVGKGPSKLAYDPQKGEVFVTNSLSNTTSIISDATNTVVDTVIVGDYPVEVAYDSGKGEVFVVNDNYNYGQVALGTVSIISDSNDSVVKTVTVGSFPSGIAYDSGSGEMYVANSGIGYGFYTVSIISDRDNAVNTVLIGSTSSPIKFPPFLGSPGPLVYDSGKGAMYVADSGGNTAEVVSDKNGTLTVFKVGDNPSGLDYDPIRNQILVLNQLSRTLLAISDSSHDTVGSIPVKARSTTMAYDYGKDEVYVVSENANWTLPSTVTAIPAASIKSEFPTWFNTVILGVVAAIIAVAVVIAAFVLKRRPKKAAPSFS